MNQTIPEHLYHYTKINVLHEIFNDPEGKNVRLRFTDMHFLNDTEEGIYFYRFIEKYKDEIVKKFKDGDEQEYCKCAIEKFLEYECYRYRLEEQSGKHYICSFSELPDYAYFWLTNYANENGIALRLNTSACEPFDNPYLSRVRYFNVESIDQLMPDFVNTVREDSKYIDIQRGSADEPECVGINGAQVLGRYPFSVIKNKIWEHEREWRMVRSLKALDLSMATRPFIEKKMQGKFDEKKIRDKDVKETFEIDEYGVPRYYLDMPNPFDEIILGPMISNDFENYINDWLNRRNYKIRVEKSSIPLRPRR